MVPLYHCTIVPLYHFRFAGLGSSPQFDRTFINNFEGAVEAIRGDPMLAFKDIAGRNILHYYLIDCNFYESSKPSLIKILDIIFADNTEVKGNLSTVAATVAVLECYLWNWNLWMSEPTWFGRGGRGPGAGSLRSWS